MQDKHKLRAWIAVIAAYVIALQAFLTSVVATQMAVSVLSDPSAICLGHADGAAPQQPGAPSHAAHQACIICTFASAGALSPPAAAFVFHKANATAAPWHILVAPTHLARHRSPQIPRGPPEIA
jgi:hypothetical protein